MYYANKSKRKILLTVIIAGLSELLGALLTYWFLLPFISNFILGIMLSITAGIMLGIGLFSLLNEAYQYNKVVSVIGFIIGILIMIISEKFM